MTDEQLVENFKKGTSDALDRLIERYYEQVYKTCYHFLNNTHDAMDATQDVFIKVCQNLSAYQSNAKFRTWLYRVSVNHCLNVLRSKKRKKWLLPFADENRADPPNELQFTSNEKDPERNTLDQERQQVIKKAIDSLPLDQKTAVILFRYQGLSCKEIAEVTNKSVSSVESRLFRAHKKLYSLLEHYFKNE